MRGETISDAGASRGLQDLKRSDGKKLLLSYLFAPLQVFQVGWDFLPFSLII